MANLRGRREPVRAGGAALAGLFEEPPGVEPLTVLSAAELVRLHAVTYAEGTADRPGSDA